MKLYIAGPMSGLPDMNYPEFRRVARILKKCGYEVEDPSDNVNPDSEDYITWLRLGLKQVLECDGIALLDGFGLSKGAMMEAHVAAFLMMPVRPWLEWFNDAESTAR